MTEEQIILQFDELKKTYPGVKHITIDYYGSGDSFDDYDVNCNPSDAEIKKEDIENLMWHFIDNVAGSDFNDEGGRGTITIDLTDNTIRIEDFYYTREEELNCDKSFNVKDASHFKINNSLDELIKLTESKTK